MLIHLGTQFQRGLSRNRSTRNKKCLWRPCVLADQDKMSNLYRGPSIDASYQIFVHLGKWFQRRRLFRNRPIRNKNCLWRRCLLTDQDEMSNHYRGTNNPRLLSIKFRFIWRSRFREEDFFRNRPTRNENCMWRPCL
jgi:hypothetical protein